MGISDSAHELPRVSVVVPVLNGAREIPRLLDSLLAVEYPTSLLEVLVVDNGSSDGTPSVAERSGVRVLSEPLKRSSYAARNRGGLEASGEWIAFTDADCVATKGWLSTLLAPPIAMDVGAVVGEVVGIDLETPVQRLTERFGLMRHAVTLPHKGLPCFSTANVAVRREALLAHGGFRDDVRFFGDMDLSWRLQTVGSMRILFRPGAVVGHRHRRTYYDLFRQGIQHGRGVAFMRRAHPNIYSVSGGEQMARIGQLFSASARALRGVLGWSPHRGAREPDAMHVPVFLTVWYAGLLTGYLRGPAWTPRSGGSSAPR